MSCAARGKFVSSVTCRWVNVTRWFPKSPGADSWLYSKFANPVPSFPPEAAAEGASMATGDQYPGEAATAAYGEAATAAGIGDLDEDMTCEMILNMLSE